jgi:integrase
MPKSSSPPKYRHFKPRNLAVVRIDGRDHYLGTYGSKESKERYARLIAQLDCAPLVAVAPRTDVSVTELVANYWSWATAYYVRNGRPSGHLSKVRRSLQVLRELYGSTSAAAFGPLAMRNVQRHCTKADMSRIYINDICAEIRRVFKWATSHEILPPTIYQALTTVPGLKHGRSQARDNAPVMPVDEATVAATLPYLPPAVQDMVRFHVLVGCRPSEVCILRPCDVDTKGETWTYTPAEHKTQHIGRERRIFIGPKAQDVLRGYLLRPTDSYCFSPVESERQRHAMMRGQRKNKVQPSQVDRNAAKPVRPPKEKYTKDSYNRAVARAVDKANAAQLAALTEALGRRPNDEEAKTVLLQCWSPNQLRHAAATEIRRQYGIEAAQTVLGHSTADVTSIYAERDWAKAADVMKAIG